MCHASGCMNLGNESPNAAGTGAGASWAVRLASPLTIAALMLATMGLGLLWVSVVNTDLPPLPEFMREAREVYLPAVHGEVFSWNAVGHDHAPVAHVWKLAWLALN